MAAYTCRIQARCRLRPKIFAIWDFCRMVPSVWLESLLPISPPLLRHRSPRTLETGSRVHIQDLIISLVYTTSLLRSTPPCRRKIRTVRFLPNSVRLIGALYRVHWRPTGNLATAYDIHATQAVTDAYHALYGLLAITLQIWGRRRLLDEIFAILVFRRMLFIGVLLRRQQIMLHFSLNPRIAYRCCHIRMSGHRPQRTRCRSRSDFSSHRRRCYWPLLMTSKVILGVLTGHCSEPAFGHAAAANASRHPLLWEAS